MTDATGKRRWYTQNGPGALVAAAFIGPGTVTVCTLAGVNFGYDLLWVMLLSVFATMVLQEMSARIGIVTGRGLTDVIRTQLKNLSLTRYIVLLVILSAIVIGNAAYEAGNISGGRLGLETLLGITSAAGSRWLSLVIGTLAFALLFIGSYRLLERALIGMVIMMSLAFVMAAVLTRPDLTALLQGLLRPSLNDASILTILGLIGTTVVPYNLFLHASLVSEKWRSADDLPHARRDTFIAIAIGGLVSMAIIICAAAVNAADISNAADLARGLEPLFGSFARYFLSLGLFAAGITSAITAPLAAAYVVRGCMGWPKDLKHTGFRLVWMFILGIGITFSSLGINPIDIIRFAQVANGLALPLVVAILLWIMNQTAVLGEHKNTRLNNVLGSLILLVTVALGTRTIIQVMASL
ncbi:manganese transporter [Pseudohongiella acticola]|uniref:Manganese transporter n=1 Tax=Pseudohongiella acticola TaxID=1524254 RepID=A0A1E8CIC0_9GAMM|nr:Nramp family divalent metal transporter [Pseudohongiella acticola]OFE12240.1 manganese transporter [Pseudohongiella acticola]